MPFTPFHFGPGLFIKACAPGAFWLSSFILANVLIDIEVLYYILRGEAPLHRHVHSYIGGVAIGFVAAVLMLAIVLIFEPLLVPNSRWQKKLRVNSRLGMFLQSLSAGIIGGVSHILLDSCMHHDMHPFWPFAEGNALAGVISVGVLHVSLAIMGFFGVMIWLLMRDD